VSWVREGTILSGKLRCLVPRKRGRRYTRSHVHKQILLLQLISLGYLICGGTSLRNVLHLSVIRKLGSHERGALEKKTVVNNALISFLGKAFLNIEETLALAAKKVKVQITVVGNWNWQLVGATD